VTLGALSWLDLAWAFHSNSQPFIVSKALHAVEPARWNFLRATGFPVWLRSHDTLREQAERIARARFAASRNPMDAMVLYIALGRRAQLAALFRAVRDTRLAEFLANDFDTEGSRWRTAALKNAYVLLSQHRYEHAAGFFLLGGAVQDALVVLAERLGDPMLAVLAARLISGPEPEDGTTGGPTQPVVTADGEGKPTTTPTPLRPWHSYITAACRARDGAAPLSSSSSSSLSSSAMSVSSLPSSSPPSATDPCLVSLVQWLSGDRFGAITGLLSRAVERGHADNVGVLHLHAHLSSSALGRRIIRVTEDAHHRDLAAECASIAYHYELHGMHLLAVRSLVEALDELAAASGDAQAQQQQDDSSSLLTAAPMTTQSTAPEGGQHHRSPAARQADADRTLAMARFRVASRWCTATLARGEHARREGGHDWDTYFAATDGPREAATRASPPTVVTASAAPEVPPAPPAPAAPTTVLALDVHYGTAVLRADATALDRALRSYCISEQLVLPLTEISGITSKLSRVPRPRATAVSDIMRIVDEIVPLIRLMPVRSVAPARGRNLAAVASDLASILIACTPRSSIASNSSNNNNNNNNNILKPTHAGNKVNSGENNAEPGTAGPDSPGAGSAPPSPIAAPAEGSPAPQASLGPSPSASGALPGPGLPWPPSRVRCSMQQRLARLLPRHTRQHFSPRGPWRTGCSC
jgi:hypothetical protein